MTNEKRARKLRKAAGYKPGHPDNKTKYKNVSGYTNLKQNVCIGKRGIYRRMKRIDKILRTRQ